MTHAIIIFTAGLIVGMALQSRISKRSLNYYRTWYLVLRNTIDKDRGQRGLAALKIIGQRTSVREPFEDQWDAKIDQEIR